MFDSYCSEVQKDKTHVCWSTLHFALFFLLLSYFLGHAQTLRPCSLWFRGPNDSGGNFFLLPAQKRTSLWMNYYCAGICPAKRTLCHKLSTMSIRYCLSLVSPEILPWSANKLCRKDCFVHCWADNWSICRPVWFDMVNRLGLGNQSSTLCSEINFLCPSTRRVNTITGHLHLDERDQE